MSGFDVVGALRRIRREADASQREFAEKIGVPKSTLAAAESGDRGLDVRVLAVAAETVGFRLALVDGNGVAVEGMTVDSVRDRSGRRFPAHLDTRYSDEGWWHGPERYSRAVPWYTFDRDRDRDRERRDGRRRTRGTPSDHQLPQWGDAPAARGRLATRGAVRLSLPAGVRRARRPVRSARPRARLPVWLRHLLIRCYRDGVRGSLLLTRRGEALS